MLYVITWLSDFAAFLLVFTVGRQLAERGADALFMGVVGAAFCAANVFSNPLAGRLSDRLGRRRVAGFGAAFLFACTLAVAALDPQRWPYFAAYAAAGGALGFIYPPLIAWLSHGRRGRDASAAHLGFCLAWNFGMICGQLGGGLFYEWGGSDLPLRVATGLVVLNFVLLLLTPEVRGGSAKGVPIAQLPPGPEIVRESELSPRFIKLAWVANVGGTFAGSVVLFLFPRLAVGLEVPSERHGALLAVNRAVVIGMFVLMHRTTFWRHRFSTALATQAVGLLGLFGLATAQSNLGLAASLAGLAVLQGYNYFASLYYSTTGSAHDRTGAASGVHEATLAFGLAGGSLLGGVAAQYGDDRTPFYLAACVVAALAFVQVMLFASLRQARRRNVPEVRPTPAADSRLTAARDSC